MMFSKKECNDGVYGWCTWRSRCPNDFSVTWNYDTNPCNSCSRENDLLSKCRCRRAADEFPASVICHEQLRVCTISPSFSFSDLRLSLKETVLASTARSAELITISKVLSWKRYFGILFGSQLDSLGHKLKSLSIGLLTQCLCIHRAWTVTCRIFGKAEKARSQISPGSWQARESRSESKWSRMRSVLFIVFYEKT